MKRSEYNVLIRTVTFVTFRARTFVPAQFTNPSEEELAEGVVPTQIYSPYWSIDVAMEGPQGSRTGPEAIETTEEANDAELLQGLKIKYAPADADWRFLPDDIEEDEPVQLTAEDPDEEPVK